MPGTATIDDSEMAAWHYPGSYLRWPQGDCQIFCKEFGDASADAENTALLVHGYPESSFSFHKVVEGLAERFDRIVLVDLPGFGVSNKPERLTYSIFEQADALMFVWRALGVRGGHMISHDMGDSVASEIVARSVQDLLPAWFNEGIQSLTLTNGNMVMEKAVLIPAQKLMRNHWIGPVFSKLVNRSQFIKGMSKANGAPIEEKDLDQMWQLYERENGHRMAWKTIRYLDERGRFQNPRWLKALSRFEAPIHICWGEDDAVAPLAVARYLKDQICPQATLTLVPEAGHFFQLQAPTAWVASVLDFFDRIAPLPQDQ